MKPAQYSLLTLFLLSYVIFVALQSLWYIARRVLVTKSPNATARPAKLGTTLLLAVRSIRFWWPARVVKKLELRIGVLKLKALNGVKSQLRPWWQLSSASLV